MRQRATVEDRTRVARSLPRSFAPAIGSGAVELFEHVAALEERDRTRRGLERRLTRSRLERFKPMVDYDWNWPKKIDRPLVESVLRLDFIAEPLAVTWSRRAAEDLPDIFARIATDDPSRCRTLDSSARGAR